MSGTTVMNYVKKYLEEASEILRLLDQQSIMRLTELILDLRRRQGRLFIIGVGGGAGHASHAVCDFRKIAGIEAYAPSDNVSELTARVNDEGWSSIFDSWLRVSRLRADD